VVAVGDAGGDEHRVRAERAAAAELDEPAGALGPHGGRVLDGDELGAEAAGLVRGPLGELGALEAAGEAEVVLDPARLAGLAARGLALDQDRPQALGRAVDGRREPGGTAADDDEIIVLEARLVGDAQALGELEQRRPLEDRAVLEQGDRQAVVVNRRDPEQLALRLPLPERRTWRPVPSMCSATASCTLSSSAPRRRACVVARLASSEPLSPAGKPR